MANETTVNIEHNEETVQGQPQSSQRDPHDGQVTVRETHVTTDRVILDPNSPEAVQVPEGSGASSVDRQNPLAEALQAGTPEEQFSSQSKTTKTTTTTKDDTKS